jgi:predicted amidohydrolase
MFLAAVVQMTSTADPAANWTQARALIERAAQRGAWLVATPENASYLGPSHDKPRLAEPLDGPEATRWAGLAQSLGIYLLLGSFAEAAEVAGRCHNTSLLFAPDGAIVGVYRKIHLFDADLPDGTRYRESEVIAPGHEAVVARTGLGAIGMTVCYDLRFGNLYRRLAREGAEVLTIPAAFTMQTGRAHWEVLVRARAIETQCYVLAPAQCGAHDDAGVRESYGQSMIVDPWGTVVARVPDGPGIALAEIDRERVVAVRAALPVARHARGHL